AEPMKDPLNVASDQQPRPICLSVASRERTWARCRGCTERPVGLSGRGSAPFEKLAAVWRRAYSSLGRFARWLHHASARVPDAEVATSERSPFQAEARHPLRNSPTTSASLSSQLA